MVVRRAAFAKRQGIGVAADGVILRGGKVLLIRRTNPPFIGWWVLPGGWMKLGEMAEQTARREMREETGLLTRVAVLVGVFSDPRRDPRGHVISIAFRLRVVGGRMLQRSREMSEARFFPLARLPKQIGFDHREIIRTAARGLD